VTCHDVVQLVEAIAAGDLAVDDEVRAHVESCPHCAAALASAHRLEVALAAWPQPAAPEAFTTAVLARVRNERWTSEQRIDRMFNAAIVFAGLVAVAGIAALTNIGGVLAGADWLLTVTAAATAQMARQAAPVIATYVAAAGVLMTALLMWWWAERRLTL
jgi:anti-sigma factor RsiW